MRHYFELFKNTQPHTFQEALPRTVASIIAGQGAIAGLTMGGMLAGLASGARMALPVAITATGGLVGTSIGYAAGYMGANLLMAALPSIQEKSSRLLLPSGNVKAQLALGIASAAAGAAPFIFRGTSSYTNYYRVKDTSATKNAGPKL